jgi:dUTP pyrophosphatase
LKWNVHPERNQDWRDRQTKELGDKKSAQECDCDFLTSGNTVVDAAIIEEFKKTTIKDPLEMRGIEKGYWIRIESRSGMFFRNGITAFQGVIDCSYRGKLGASLINNTDVSYQVKTGDRIAQLVVYKLLEPTISWAETKDETTRGDKGFGSSGR